jgi:hypothetical protein
MAGPLVQLDPQGNPHVLSYDLPEPSSYRGRYIIELDFPLDYFVEHVARNKNIGQPAVALEEGNIFDPGYPALPIRKFDLNENEIKTAFQNAKSTGYFDPKIFPNVGGGRDQLSSAGMKKALDSLDEKAVVMQLLSGNRLSIFRTSTGNYEYRFITGPNMKCNPRLVLVEYYRLSSYLGRYGVGRTLKTFSLLPGEKTTIKITTYKRSETTFKQASSILDSVTEETQREFERTVLQEQSSQDSSTKSFEYHAEAEAEAKANWGWGSGSIQASGGIKGGS